MNQISQYNLIPSDEPGLQTKISIESLFNISLQLVDNYKIAVDHIKSSNIGRFKSDSTIFEVYRSTIEPIAHELNSLDESSIKLTRTLKDFLFDLNSSQDDISKTREILNIMKHVFSNIGEMCLRADSALLSKDSSHAQNLLLLAPNASYICLEAFISLSEFSSSGRLLSSTNGSSSFDKESFNGQRRV